MKKNEIKLIKDLYKHYDQNQDVNEDFIKTLSDDYGSIRGILMNVILKYDPDANVSEDYINNKLNEYNINDIDGKPKTAVGKSDKVENSHPEKSFFNKYWWIILIVIFIIAGLYQFNKTQINYVLNNALVDVYDDNYYDEPVTQEEIYYNEPVTDLYENISVEERKNNFKNNFNFTKLKTIENSSSSVDYDLFRIKIKDDKFRINVRNTYDIPNSYVLTQVSEKEFYTVSKNTSTGNDLLTLGKDLKVSLGGFDAGIGGVIVLNDKWTADYYQKSQSVTFSKGIKLENIYESYEYIYGEKYYLADLIINVGKENETKYFVTIHSSYVDRKQNSNWYYLNELNGWILSDFCDTIQLKNNSLAVIDDSDGWSNVREEQTTKSNILFKIFDDQKFIIITNYGRWSLISFNDKTGYISNSVVKLIE